MFQPPDLPAYCDRVSFLLVANTKACQWEVIEQGDKVLICLVAPLEPVTVVLRPMPAHLTDEAALVALVRSLAKEAIERSAVATFLNGRNDACI